MDSKRPENTKEIDFTDKVKKKESNNVGNDNRSPNKGMLFAKKTGVSWFCQISTILSLGGIVAFLVCGIAIGPMFFVGCGVFGATGILSFVGMAIVDYNNVDVAVKNIGYTGIDYKEQNENEKDKKYNENRSNNEYIYSEKKNKPVKFEKNVGKKKQQNNKKHNEIKDDNKLNSEGTKNKKNDDDDNDKNINDEEKEGKNVDIDTGKDETSNKNNKRPINSKENINNDRKEELE